MFSAEVAARDLGLLVASTRREYGVTQADVAALAGISIRSLHAIETGKPTIRLDIVLPVLHVLGIELTPRAIEDKA